MQWPADRHGRLDAACHLGTVLLLASAAAVTPNGWAQAPAPPAQQMQHAQLPHPPHHPPPAAIDAKALLAQAALQHAAGQYGQAVPGLELALRELRRQRGEHHADTVKATMMLARSYQALGQLQKALPLDERLLSVLIAQRGRRHRDTLAAMVNVSTSYHDLGQLQRALRLQTLGLQRAEQALGADDAVTVSALVSMATIHASLNQPEEAVRFDRRVLQARQRRLPAEHPDIESALNNLSNSLFNAGQVEASVPLAEQALASRRARLGPLHPATLVSATNLAETYLGLRRHSAAQELLDEIVPQRLLFPGPGHADTLIAQHALVQVLHQTGQTPRALAVAAAAAQGIELRRQLPGLDDAQRQGVLATFAQDLLLYARLHGLAGSAGSPAWAAGFALAESVKARTLVETMTAVAAERQAALSDAERRSLLELEQRAVLLEQSLAAHAQAGGRDVAAGLALAAQRRAVLEQLAAERARIAQRHPALAQAQRLVPLDVDAAAARLGSGTAYISLMQAATGHVQAWVLRQGRPVQFVDLGLHAGLGSSVAAYRALLSAQRPPALWQRHDGAFTLNEKAGDAQPDADPASQAAQPRQPPTAAATRVRGDAAAVVEQHLGRVLLQPLQEQLAGTTAWVVAADANLALLPLEALPWQGGRVVDAVAVTRVQSLAVLEQLHQRQAQFQYRQAERAVEPGRLLLAMGDARYGPARSLANSQRGATRGWRVEGAAPPRGRLARPGAAGDAQAASIPLSALRWSPLPGTRREVEAVARALQPAQAPSLARSTSAPSLARSTSAREPTPPGNQVSIYTGAEASEERLAALNADGTLRQYRYLLFAAHGYLSTEPALTSLVLSQHRKTAAHDGYVTAAEWARYRLGSELVVLSACDTGAGKAVAGEGLLGLPFALLAAGNVNTLLTLWPVDDEATADFMAHLFQRLAAGDTPVQALSATRRFFMQHPQWSAPRYWAPFVLYGPGPDGSTAAGVR